MFRTKYTIGAATANGICASQAGTANVALLLNGALTRIQPENGFRDWFADVPRVVTITSAGDDTGITFTITGVSGGKLTTETLAGANGAKAFVTVWDEISSIVPSGNTAANVTVGTTNAVKTPWIPLNAALTPFNVNMIVNTTAIPTVTYSAESTLDDVYDTSITPAATAHASMAAKTAAFQAVYDTSNGPVAAIRLNMTLFSVGTVTFEALQAGIDTD